MAPADWVYRPNLQDSTGAVIDDLGTYDPQAGTLVGGAANANFHVLYDSHNRFAAMQSLGFGFAGMPMAARAEAHRPKIIRVQGVLLGRPSAWAVNNVIGLGLRFGIFEQDAQGGSVLIDPSYSLWANGIPGVNQIRAATWANDRNWQREYRRRLENRDSANSPYWTIPFNFRVNRRLDPNECYGVYMESDIFAVSSANLIYQWWMRTLVSDEG